METMTKQALRFAENLTLPPVVVMSANMGCIHCRQRVSQVISKMNGLLEYVVDVHNKQVIMKGTLTDPDQTERMALLNFPTKSKKNKSSFSLCLFGSTCFSA
ncbi:PREDICTED: uncharacterized protein LOC104598538 isoform X2 [Nelumbo nucifera]|uniref:HMA domain-containing protein n=2 Tax=Nelumbo nucifera TaxID=4432 RepID=A0A822ZRD1_NELNU|nr:PREDICTED: uncharacterized protein LOC104598538 isoform X2 [Nelumbo nucifera]DAD47802.1 TPA_asm: hypothetical protein HUJ06_017739 [Nelumbo nucifera]